MTARAPARSRSSGWRRRGSASDSRAPRPTSTRRRGVREGRPLSRAGAPSGPADRAAAPARRKGRWAILRRSRGMTRWRRLPSNFTRAVAQRYGSEAVWPYHSGGTMGVVQRYGLDRLRHAMRYSRQQTTICVTPAQSGWTGRGGRDEGRRSARDGGERADRGVGRQSGLHPGQRDGAYQPGAQARGEAGGGRRLSQRRPPRSRISR